MTTTRLWTAGAVLIMALIVALGWFLGVAPRLTEARAADAERAGVQVVNAGYEETLVRLKELDDDLPALTNQLEELRGAIPSDAQISTLLGQLNSLAADSGVSITSIEADVPVSFGEALAEAGAAFESEEEPAAAEGAEGAEAPDGAEANDEAAPTPAVDPALAGVPDNFVAVPIKVIVQGDPERVVDFIEKVQYGTRLFLVFGLEIVYDGGGGEVGLEGLVYVLTEDAPADEDTAETAPAEGD